MPAVLLVLKSVLSKMFWSFLGERVIAKAVWYYLERAAKQTTNGIDDDIVADAKKAYYGL